MKVLLINPPNFNEIRESLPYFVEKEKGITPPLGILYIAAYAKKYTKHEIFVLDCQIENLNYDKLEKKIKQINPDIIGITALSMAAKDVIKTIKSAKRVNADSIIVIGGPHASCYPRETAQWPDVDYVIYGEGEKPFTQLINSLNEKRELLNIKGLVYFDRKNNKIMDNGPAEPIENLDELPFPARELVPYKSYNVLLMRSPVTSLFTSRGCPYKCKFCDRPALGKVFRARSADNVFREINECIKLGIKDFLVYDDTFTVDQQRVIEICKKIINEKLDIQFNVRARVNTVSPELLNYLKRAGCMTIHYGVESGSEKILKAINKGIILEQVNQALSWTKKEKIQSLAYFMIGNPDETKEDIEKTISLIRSIAADYVIISLFTPFPRTISYEEGIKQEIFSDKWLEFAKNPDTKFEMPVWDNVFSKKELENFVMKAYRAFYLRPKIIIKEFLKLKNPKDFINKTRTALKIIFKS